MNDRLMQYYQGSVSTPEGFKGFMPGATPAETAWICSQLPPAQQAQYVQCRPATLPQTGPDGFTVFAALFLAIVWVAIAALFDLREHGKLGADDE